MKTDNTGYIFLTNNEDEGFYYAISADTIETLELHDTYDRNGQVVGHGNAGDYHMENSECDAIKDCKKEIAEKFGIDLEDIDINSDSGTFEIEAEDMDAALVKAINGFINKWREENENITEVEGFNFWDGHNWKTVVVQAEDFTPAHNIVDNEELIAELNKAIEEMQFIKEGHGTTLYRSGSWIVEDSHWQGTWDRYRIYDAALREMND